MGIKCCNASISSTEARRCSKQSIPSKNCGAPGRVRTRDPLITNQVLYQLSYKGNARQLADFAAL